MDEIVIDIKDISTEADIHLCLCEEDDCIVNNMEFHFVIDTEQVQDILDFLDVDFDYNIVWKIEYTIGETKFFTSVDDIWVSFRRMGSGDVVSLGMEFVLDRRDEVFKLLDGKDKKPDEQKLKIYKKRIDSDAI